MEGAASFSEEMQAKTVDDAKESAGHRTGDKKRRRSFVDEEAELTAPARRRGISFDDAEVIAAASVAPPRQRLRGLSIDAFSARTAAAFCAEHDMRVTGPASFVCPPPMETFAATPFPASLTAKFTEAGFTAPTMTQAMAWPIALTGCNIVTVAKTGSGKTLGFLLPVFQALQAARAAGGHASSSSSSSPFSRTNFNTVATPSLLVMAPTRELACQIEEEAIKFGAGLGFKTACLYGGAPKGPQCRALRMSPDIVIGTPGRMQDMLDMKVLTLSGIRFLVLDEADRMLDMGFEDSIRAIIALAPTARQTLLFTATWPRAIQRLADEFCPRSVQMSVGNTDVLAANKSILQTIEIVRGQQAKEVRLIQLLASLYKVPGATPSAPAVVNAQHGKCIIFVKFKHACNRIAESLWQAGFSVNTLHGDMEQRERTQVIDEFKAGKLRVLVATDVAARGLDVKDVTHVVNFDFPFGK